MTDSSSNNTNRRVLLRRMVGAGAASLAAPFVPQMVGMQGPSLISQAKAAAGYSGARKNQGNLVHIPDAAARKSRCAEWYDPAGPTGPYRIAGNAAALESAPKDASFYEAKLYDFPSGAVRVLTWKKGMPVAHMITFETEILVLSGSATLKPLIGFAGAPVEIKKGDALFLPAGNLTNPNPSEDLVLLTFVVSPSKNDAKSSIVSAADAPVSEALFWQENGKMVSANTPKDMTKAPANAMRQLLQRYTFDGNSIRIATYSAGGRTSTFTITRTDVLIYVPKGRFRRMEGHQMLELSAGDALREKIGNPGWWEPLEDDSTFIATDAPVLPAMPYSASI